MGSTPTKQKSFSVTSPQGKISLDPRPSSSPEDVAGSPTKSPKSSTSSPLKPSTKPVGVGDVTTEFREACLSVFERVDVEKTGYVTVDAFREVFASPDFNMKLSSEELNSLIQDVSKSDSELLHYIDFFTKIKSLLQNMYRDLENDWNDWAMVRNVKTGVKVYFNKRTGAKQFHEPQDFDSIRIEASDFQNFILEDGTELTTYIDRAGQRLYLNWDTQQWDVFPEEWNYLLEQKPADEAGANGDPRIGQYIHPVKGTITTYMFENPRNTRLYFDEDIKDWARMPLLWECHVPDVMVMMEELDRMFPDWQNVHEQLLVLRECNYDLQEAAMFVEINWTFAPKAPPRLSQTMARGQSFIAPKGGVGSRPTLSDHTSSTPSSQPASDTSGPAGKRDDKAKDSSKKTSTEPTKSAGSKRSLTKWDLSSIDEGGDGPTSTPSLVRRGSFSITAANRIHELETLLAQKDIEIENLKDELQEDSFKALENIKREKTQVESSLHRKDRHNQEAMNKIGELSRETLQQREKIRELERELVSAKADRERVSLLEKEILALTRSKEKDGIGAALQEKDKQLQQARDENVVLKMKMQSLKDKIDNPLKNKTTIKLLSGYHKQIKALQEEKSKTQKELSDNLAVLAAMFNDLRRKSKLIKDNVARQVEEITAKYRAEALQRKLLYNKVQELRGNIRVFCRSRKDTRETQILKFPSENEIMLPSLKGEEVLMEFDHTYGPETTQEQVFEDTKPTIMSVVDGYNVCIVAYGQTGSGKTYTMMGPVDNPGVNRRAIKELIELIGSKEEIEYTMTVSLLEIYNENIYDLLSAKGEQKLQIHQGPAGVYVDGLITRTVTSQQEVEAVMAEGDRNRSVAATSMNSSSSRSHLLLQITVTGYNKISKMTSTGKLTLVDLAGSERVAKTEATGQRLVEAAAINKSLSALGQVFKALASNAPHVPYRNSKLTHILQDSLGGDSKTCVFINVSPAPSNLAETHCSLLFGKNISKIELGPAKKHASNMPTPKR